MEPRSIYELFQRVGTAGGNTVAYRHKKDGRWNDVTWSEQREAVARICKSLIKLGVARGDRVSILSRTRLEWVQCDSAIVNAGGVSVGIYHSSLGPDCVFVLGHCEAEILFVEDDAQLQKILPARAELPRLRHIVVFDGPSDETQGVLSWRDFLDRSDGITDARLETLGQAIESDDLAALVYTSGTTGRPKAAMITHANLLFTARAAAQSLPFEPHFVTLLFLPLAHVFARLIVYVCIYKELTVAFAEDLSTVATNLEEIRPHFIVSVPRIYEKFYEGVMARVEQSGTLRQRLFDWAVGVGRQSSLLRLQRKPVPAGLRFRRALADRLVLLKIRATLGGRIVWAASGAAPLNKQIAEFFYACGIPILEGLGMTENTSLSNANRMEHNKLGTVGRVVPGVEMKLAADGEILFRGPNVMKGYFKDPEATAETIDGEGWLHSGDVGEIDDEGFLRITDRKKDLIITAGGKNIAPQRIEKTLCTSRLISQAVAYGDKRKYVSALIALDQRSIHRWATQNGLESMSLEDLVRHEKVRELIGAEIEERNRDLASFESVKRFHILPRELSVEHGEVTPSLKIKRKVVAETYRDLIDAMYQA